MKTEIITDSLNMVNQAIANTIESGNSGSDNWWMMIAIVELLIILFFLFKPTEANKKDILKKRVKEENVAVDFGNIINSAFNAKPLYDTLIRACHPDRFPNDEEKIAIANSLAQFIGKNKNNYNELLRLKQEAEKLLNIKITNN